MRSYKDIIEGLTWFVGWRKESYTKSQCENAMKWLRRATMIATKKTARGMFIKIDNYDYYQDIKNYESHRRATNVDAGEPQSSHTINKEEKEIKEIKNGEYSSLQTLTDSVLSEIAETYKVPINFVMSKREDLQLYCSSKGKTYKNYKLALMSWVKKDAIERIDHAKRSDNKRGIDLSNL